MGGRGVKNDPNPDDEAIPAWQRQSIRRSLRSARARAHARSNGFVKAARTLLLEKGNAEFTVQDVVERSEMSIRTFYKYFASKEDLMVAVYETAIAQEAVPRLKKRIDKHRDPVLRLRAYIEGLIELSSKTGPAGRTLTSFQNRLTESRPEDLARAMKPQFDLLMDLIEDVSQTQPLHRGLTIETAARLTHYTVLAAVHGRLLGSDNDFEVSGPMIWRFCAAGMGFSVDGTSSQSRRSPRHKRSR